MKISKNENTEVVQEIQQALQQNNGYCPCRLDKNSNTKCMCEEFKQQSVSGLCHCGLYKKEV